MGWGGIDTRRSVRVTFECIVKVKKEGSSLLFDTETENLSQKGVCVILERELLKKTPVELELFLPDDFPPAKCSGKIAWSLRRNQYVKKKPFQFDTGIEVTEIFDQDKARIKHIIDELVEY